MRLLPRHSDPRYDGGEDAWIISRLVPWRSLRWLSGSCRGVQSLFAGSIARVIYRGLRPRPEATAEPPTEPTREQAARAAALRG